MKKAEEMERTGNSNAQTRRILMADNDPAAASMLYVYFGNRGYDVERAGDTAGLIDRILDKDYSLLIIDAGFYGEDTSKLLKVIKRIDKDIRIILTSGKAPVSLLAKAREAGVFFHAVKPFNFEELETAVIQAEKFKGGE